MPTRIDDEFRGELIARGHAARSRRAACAERVGRSRTRSRVDGRGLRRRRLLDARAARAQLLGARRGQHEPAVEGRDPRAERTLAPAAGRRRHPVVLRHDRAGARRRQRSPCDADHGRPRRRRVRRQRHQVAHHRCRRRRVRDHHGPRGRRRFGPPGDDAARRHGHARHHDRARDRHARPQLPRRSPRRAVRRRPDPRRNMSSANRDGASSTPRSAWRLLA